MDGPERLLRENKPVWIVILGTSIVRGIFWAIADVLLRKRFGSLDGRSTWKCWGWQDLRVGNVRISFRDFRSNGLDGSWPEIEATYVQDTIDNLRAIGSEEYLGRTGPDLVLMEAHAMHGYLQHPDMIRRHVDMVVDALGDQWQGELWAGGGFFNPQLRFESIMRRFEGLVEDHVPRSRQVKTYNFQV